MENVVAHGEDDGGVHTAWGLGVGCERRNLMAGEKEWWGEGCEGSRCRGRRRNNAG